MFLPHVEHIVRFVSVLFPADVTLELLFTGVRHQMSLQTRLVVEALLTVWTEKSEYASVCIHVRFPTGF